jgi:hypothetical protein
MVLLRPAAAARIGLVAVMAAAIGGAADAQSISAGAANARAAGQQDVSIADGGRDASGAPAMLDGQIQTSPDESAFAGSGANGAFDTVAGVGAGGGSTAVGGNMQPVMSADYHVVVSLADPSNSGAVSAAPAH